MAPALNLSTIEHSILPVLDTLLTDDIPNIRFNVAKSYAILVDVLKRIPAEGSVSDLEKGKSGAAAEPSPHGRELIQKSILPNLAKLQEDDDVDVRFFGMTAAKAAENEVQMSV